MLELVIIVGILCVLGAVVSIAICAINPPDPSPDSKPLD